MRVLIAYASIALMHLSAEALHVQAARVREMRRCLHAFVEGRSSRSDVAAWTRRLLGAGDPRLSPFQRHGVAAAVFDSIWNIEERVDDAFVVRDEDVRVYVEWLERGVPRPFSVESLAGLRVPVTAWGATVGLRTVRDWLDGIGWQESVAFASPATGRLFIASAALFATSAGCSLHIKADDARDEALVDLLESFSLDLADLEHIDERARATSLPRFALLRQDDNGVRSFVRSFRSLGAARKACAEIEALGHKQTYWVEPVG